MKCASSRALPLPLARLVPCAAAVRLRLLLVDDAWCNVLLRC
jgi:hypothetical protein